MAHNFTQVDLLLDLPAFAVIATLYVKLAGLPRSYLRHVFLQNT